MAIEDLLIRLGARPKGMSDTSTLGRINETLGKVTGAIDEYQKKQQEKQQKEMELMQKKFTMYKTLRQAGYSPKKAHDAILSDTNLPFEDEDLGYKKQQKDIEKVDAEIAKMNRVSPLKEEKTRTEIALKKKKIEQIQQKSQQPEEYQEDLQSAVNSIEKGADPWKVYQRIATKYPKKSTELKRILIENKSNDLLDLMAYFGSGGKK